MAKKSGTRTRTRTRTVTRTINRYRNKGGKGWGGIMAGAVAGAIPAVLARVGISLGGFTQPVADIGVGYYSGNDTLQTIGGRAIGAMLASGLTGTATGTTTSGSLVG